MESRIAKIGQAIDDLAAAAEAGAQEDGGIDDLAGRLASIWAMVAELDPALAGRLRHYANGGG